MTRLSDEQLAEKDLIDTVRTVVRLKHRIAMRRELNDLEADALEAQRKALAESKPYRLDVAAVLQDEVDGS